MKKILVVGILFSLLLSVAVWEIIYSTGVYEDLHKNLAILEQILEDSGEEIATAETLSLMEKVEKKWKNSREVLFCFGNHNTLRILDEKLTSLSVMIKINHAEDAKVTVSVAKSLVEAISNDTHPIPSNLF